MSDKHPWQDADRLKEMHHGREMTQTEIAKELGCTDQTVRRWLRKHGIDVRAHTHHAVQENHPNYRNDIPREYSDSWPELAEEVRERDGFECIRCGSSNEDHKDSFGRSLEVHHIKPAFDRNGGDDSKENLATLCVNCHRIVEPLTPEETKKILNF